MAGAILLGLVLASNSQAQSGVTGAAATPSPSARAQLAAQLVQRWSNHIQEVYKTSPEQWASSMAPLFEQASVDTLARAAAARTFDAMNDEPAAR